MAVLRKLHEETVRGTATEVHAHFEKKEPRGKIVVGDFLAEAKVRKVGRGDGEI